MIEVEPFRRDHYERMTLQPSQVYLGEHLSPEQAGTLSGTDAFAAVLGDVVLGVGGAFAVWPGRAIAWAILSDQAGRHFVALHRIVRRFFDMCPHRRVEFTVDFRFAPAHRWARMLGFTLEADRMVAYDPDGRDHSLYARVRP